jgi:hypothetical protein
LFNEFVPARRMPHGEPGSSFRELIILGAGPRRKAAYCDPGTQRAVAANLLICYRAAWIYSLHRSQRSRLNREDPRNHRSR